MDSVNEVVSDPAATIVGLSLTSCLMSSGAESSLPGLPILKYVSMCAINVPISKFEQNVLDDGPGLQRRILSLYPAVS